MAHKKDASFPPELEELVRALARAAEREHWFAHLRHLEWQREEKELKRRIRENRKRLEELRSERAQKSDSNVQPK